MKFSKWTTASIVCATLLAASLYGCYYFMRMPPLRSRNTLDLSYLQSAEYAYTAHVKPSLLYDNRTMVSAGEPLYLKLVDRLDITLTYKLTQTPKTVEMTDIKLLYGVSASLGSGDWSKTYHLASTKKGAPAFSDTYTVDVKEIQGIVETIGKETGTGIHTYTYEIKPQISLEASAGGEPVAQEFTPTLKIKFEGGKIVFEGLRSTKPGSVTHSETEAATWSFLGLSAQVGAMKAASIIASISLAALLTYSMRFTLQERASRPFMERLGGDVREKIIEAREPPERIEKIGRASCRERV